MNRKFRIKIIIDLTMTVLLLFLMARQVIGDSAHEWIGASMFILWITHNILNRGWYCNLLKGKYNRFRIIQTVANICLLLSMLGMMVSGIILSKEVFVFLPISGGISFARSLHVVSVFWGFVLMAFHLGLHWNMVIGMMRKITGTVPSKGQQIVLRTAATAVAGYGLYAFVKNQFLSYMLMHLSFVFFDYEKPVFLFFAEYVGIMGLFVFLAHYGVKVLQNIPARKLLFFPLGILFIAGCVWVAEAQNRDVETVTADSSPHALSAANIFAMDTVITLEAYGDDGDVAVSESEALIHKLERLWSVTADNSEIYRVNSSGGKPVLISDETRSLIDFTLEIAEKTNGALDPTIYPVLRAWGFTTGDYRVPDDSELSELLSLTGYENILLDGNTLILPEEMAVDLGAVAKGYTGDLLRELMIGKGVSSAIINLGGNVTLIGNNPYGDRWKVGIRSPYGDGNIGILEAEDTNIVTSGGYERYFTGPDGTAYGHILNPADGRPVDNELLSVTVVGKEGRLCDALSTSMFVKGLSEASKYWRVNEGFGMILITKNSGIYVTEDLTESFYLTESSQGIPVHVLKR